MRFPTRSNRISTNIARSCLGTRMIMTAKNRLRRHWWVTLISQFVLLCISKSHIIEQAFKIIKIYISFVRWHEGILLLCAARVTGQDFSLKWHTSFKACIDSNITLSVWWSSELKKKSCFSIGNGECGTGNRESLKAADRFSYLRPRIHRSLLKDKFS